MFKPMFRRQLQADAVAPCELQRCAGAPGVIDRTDGVYDVLRWKVVTRRYASLACRATTQSAAFFEEFRSCRSVYRSVNSTST